MIPQWGIISRSLDWPSPKSLQTINPGEGVEKRECFCTVGGNVNWYRLIFELWCWRRLLRVPWTARRSNQSILKDINPGISLEGMKLKLKLQYFGHLMRRADPLNKTLRLRQEEKGMTEDEMVGWHHWLNGHEFEQAPGDGEGQGSLASCSPWGCKE